MNVLRVILLVAVTVSAREYTDEELSSFPRLFHLDDYERCLAKKDGLYCLGTFDLTPDVLPNPTYELLKVYSDESRHFNRTRIHRGYCVSTRCPQALEGNTSHRFEKCVDKFARPASLRASINTLHYCHVHEDKYAETPRTPAQQLFLQSICAIIAINIIATIYDVLSGDAFKKNKFITAFSIPDNWRRLVTIHEGGDSRLSALTPLNGIRVIAMGFSTYAHATVFHYGFYTLNPDFLEKHSHRADFIYLSDGTSLVQGLLMMSCFLTGYNLLIFSQKRSLNVFLLPMYIHKRLVRTLPMSLLVVSFGATWWMHTREGPLVPATIGVESQACQSNFWSHMFYVNNMVDSSEYCITPSWFLPVDMHLYIVACTLTLIMWRRRSSALKLYLILFLASCALNAAVIYIKGYKSMIYLSRPEVIRRVYRDSPSFTKFYISSWGALPSCFLGLLLAHIQFELDEHRIKLSEYKWFVYLHYCIVPITFCWSLMGIFAQHQTSSIVHFLHTAFSRPLFSILLATTMLGLINLESIFRKIASRNIFTRMSRMSLTIMLLHWCVNMTICARPVAFGTSGLDMAVDWIATHFITYLLAIPITVLLEFPVQKFLGLLLF